MTTIRCTQKLLAALRVQPATHDQAPVGMPSGALLGDWTMNLLHVRPAKLVLAVSEYDRLGLLVEAAPFATLFQRFTEALFAHLLMLGIPPDVSRRECNAMLPLLITSTAGYQNRLSIQGNMTDYTFLVKYCLEDGMPIAEINDRLGRQISKPTGYAYPRDLVKGRLFAGYAERNDGDAGRGNTEP